MHSSNRLQAIKGPSSSEEINKQNPLFRHAQYKALSNFIALNEIGVDKLAELDADSLATNGDDEMYEDCEQYDEIATFNHVKSDDASVLDEFESLALDRASSSMDNNHGRSSNSVRDEVWSNASPFPSSSRLSKTPIMEKVPTVLPSLVSRTNTHVSVVQCSLFTRTNKAKKDDRNERQAYTGPIESPKPPGILPSLASVSAFTSTTSMESWHSVGAYAVTPDTVRAARTESSASNLSLTPIMSSSRVSNSSLTPLTPSSSRQSLTPIERRQLRRAYTGTPVESMRSTPYALSFLSSPVMENHDLEQGYMNPLVNPQVMSSLAPAPSFASLANGTMNGQPSRRYHAALKLESLDDVIDTSDVYRP